MIMRFKSIYALVFCLLFFILADCAKSPNDAKSVPQHKLAYGYFFQGWQDEMPASALSIKAHTNVLVLHSHLPLHRHNMNVAAQNGMHMILDLSTVFQNVAQLEWQAAFDSVKQYWQGLETHIAGFLLVNKPLITEHKIGPNQWRWWSRDELYDLVSLFQTQMPSIPTLIVYAPVSEIDKAIPSNLDWIGIEFFPFTDSYTPTQTEFADGWTSTEGDSVPGYRQYIQKVKNAQSDMQRPIFLIGQSFGYNEGYRFPPEQAFTWYYDLIAQDPRIMGLLWWRAFDPNYQSGGRQGVFPYRIDAQTLALHENLPAAIKIQKEIGERVVSPWTE